MTQEYEPGLQQEHPLSSDFKAALRDLDLQEQRLAEAEASRCQANNPVTRFAAGVAVHHFSRTVRQSQEHADLALQIQLIKAGESIIVED